MPPLPPRPVDATLTVTKAARLLGVHPNTVRAWSDAGRLRYYRINPRGDRRYRLGDLQRFLASAAEGLDEPNGRTRAPRSRRGRASRWAAALARPVAHSASNPAGGERLAEDPLAVDAHGDSIVADLATLAARAVSRDVPPLGDLLRTVVPRLRQELGVSLAVVWRLDGERLVPVASHGTGQARIHARPVDGVAGRALVDAADHEGAGPVLDLEPRRPLSPGLGPELAVALRCADRAWGVLTLAGPGVASPGTLRTAAVVARGLGALVETIERSSRVARQLHRAEALRRVAADLGSRLEIGQIAQGLVDHVRVLFAADRVAVAVAERDGGPLTATTHGLSAAWTRTLEAPAPGSITDQAVRERRPRFATGYANDPRAGAERAAVVQEGFDSVCVVPLFVGPDLLGVLSVHHDRPHAWDDDELDALAALAAQASVAIRAARDYAVMAQWAAQLQSIQQLGAALNRLTSVAAIGEAIATELRELIECHNVRVYRQVGEDLVPVAMRGHLGEYVDERPDQLRVRVGEGITGWVAQHKLPAYLPDAAHDPRADTVPGTEDDLDESMLLAPMIFEDEVLGVVVLAKLGLRQFVEDDLRLLVIYASFAAQAMANADATERLRHQSDALERQLRGRQDLLQITESILTTLDPRAVLDQIADRLAELVPYDNISIEAYDRASRILQPVTARGLYADEYLEPWALGETGVATWVIEHNEPVLIVDQFDDPRVRHFESTGPIHGGLVVVPLRGREGVTGVLTLERIGEGSTFDTDEFELIQLFAAQVSIAIQNAEVHRDVQIRARTDDLTGLLNHGTFQARLEAAVARGEPFAMVMIDLDGFKGVNDALGHQAGDRLLAEIGAAIQGASRDSDAVFRYGGDEFTMLLPGAEQTAALVVANRVREAIHGLAGPGTAWHGAGRRVSASSGVAVYPRHGDTAESVLLAADRACFAAKRAGPGRVATADEGLALAAEFSRARPTHPQPATQDRPLH